MTCESGRPQSLLNPKLANFQPWQDLNAGRITPKDLAALVTDNVFNHESFRLQS